MEAKVLNHIDELKVDDVFYMTDPVRVCKVTKTGAMLDVFNPITKQLERQPSCEVITIIPTMIIDGLVNKLQAQRNQTISDALDAVVQAEEAETGEVYGGSMWKEVWAERSSYALVRSNKGYMERRLDVLIKEVYVHSIPNMPSESMNCSGILHKAIEVVRLDVDSDDWFEQRATPTTSEDSEGEPEETDPEKTNNVYKLIELARTKGIDVSDIKGPGSAQRIKDRICEGLKEPAAEPVEEPVA